MKYYVYKATGLNNEILYIGKGGGDRYKHCNSGISHCFELNRYFFEYGTDSIHVEIEKYFETNEDALNNLINDIKMVQFNLCDVVDQKSFALVAKDFIFSAVLFRWKKKGGNIVDTWYSQPLNYKRKILLTLVGEKDE